jgi:hypothetical protein
MKRDARFWAASLLLMGLLAAAGCSGPGSRVTSLDVRNTRRGGASFVSSAEQRDPAQLRSCSDSTATRCSASGDAVEDSVARESFLARYSEKRSSWPAAPTSSCWK